MRGQHEAPGAAQVDDVVGAISAHLSAGIWGTLAVAIAGGADLLVQIAGVAAIGAVVFAASWLNMVGHSVDDGRPHHAGRRGLGPGVAELGIEAYPEFVVVPDDD